MDVIAKNQVNTSVSSDAIISMSVKEWAISNGWTAGMSKVIQTSKENQYPFITFLHSTDKTPDGKTAATCIYFSVEASKLVDAGEVINAELMSQFQMSYVSCPSAESGMSWKLCRKGESDKYQSPLAIL